MEGWVIGAEPAAGGLAGRNGVELVKAAAAGEERSGTGAIRGRVRRWRVLADDSTRKAADALAGRLGISRVTAQVLLNRGLSQDGECSAFLRPTLMSLHEPSKLPGMLQAAERIARAVRDGEEVVIYGDYDVDGITGSSILYHALTALGGKVRTYVPHRLEEGYGLNREAVARLCDEGARLLITVDCGVTAVEPVALARDRGVDVVVTDHHECKVGPGGELVLPEASVLVHPRLGVGESGERYANPSLCGAGVALKVAWGVGQAMLGAKVGEAFRGLLVEMTALAALGTIADVVPLVGENRALAHFGLQCLPKSQLSGVRALLRSSGLEGASLDAFDVGFKLAPRLNAAGRMGHARLAVEMLTTADEPRAAEIARYLEQQNRDRQATERKTLEEVLAEVVRRGDDRESCAGIFVAGRGWHPGVIGIVASRVVDRLHRPTVLVALDEEGMGSGSGRSIAGFHLARALSSCSELLVSCGGHEMAAGLKLREENVEAVRERFQSLARAELTDEQLVPELLLECEMSLADVTEGLAKEMARLGPFGHGNRRPVMAIRDVELALEPRRVGRSSDHLQLTLRQGDRVVKGIGFGLGKPGAIGERLAAGMRVDVAVEVVLNQWNGRTTTELEVREVRPRGG